jgi:hypothetical protein
MPKKLIFTHIQNDRAVRTEQRAVFNVKFETVDSGSADAVRHDSAPYKTVPWLVQNCWKNGQLTRALGVNRSPLQQLPRNEVETSRACREL